MTMRTLAAAGVLLAGLPLAGCVSAVSGTGTPPDPVASPTGAPYDDLAVGELALSWTQFDDGLQSAVKAYPQNHAPKLLLLDQGEYDAWVDTLDPALATTAGLELDDEVAVVGFYNRCMEQSAVFHLGGGELRYDVWIAPEDEGTVCEASPLVIEVWVVDLADLGVDAADVELA